MNDSEAGSSTLVTEDFDVFLNHRGPDTKMKFVVHLYDALRFEGFRPFLDRKSLNRMGIPNQEFIYRALGMAKVHVAVVSKGYVESEYCLDELVAIMNSGKPVIPVFYDVEPKDLLDVEKGKFAEAFENHKNHKKLQEWKDALGWLSEIVGCCFHTSGHRDEAELKQEVVDAVENEFPRGSVSFDENRRVGLEESKKEVVQKLESGRVGLVGLYGMGGIGKTTLAEAVYDYYAQDFRHRSFLKDVRSSDALTLQNQIIKDLRLGVKVDSHEDYRAQCHKFKNLKALIVVDDIDKERQFQDIIPNLDKIGKGSRIIVTSRDRGLLSIVLISTPQLDMAETERSVLHEIEGLNKRESQQLFNFHAFLNKSSNTGFEDLAVKVVDACGGHPMALEIAGAFLRNKKNKETDIVFWDEMIAWKATRDEKLQSILKISYDSGLDNCQKIMFLDISCHLIGESSAIALEIWASCESCGCGICCGVHISFRDLIEKCLVKLDKGRLRMHDVLRDMGRDIVEAVIVNGGFTKWERTHFWDPKLVDDVLKCKEGSNKVRGFSRVRQDRARDTRTRDTSIPTYDAEAFSKMSTLHLLILDGCHVSGNFSEWSRELRLLQWRFFPLPELPLEMNLAKTTVVDLSGSTILKRLWKDETPLEKALRMVVNCFFCQEFVDVQACINLRWLILNYCIALTTLSEGTGKRLSNLKVLELGNCVMLESLPDSIGEMKDLEQLILHDCQKLQSIPHTVGRLKKLKHLDLSGCSNLEILPDTIVDLANLEKLLVVGCSKLQDLPMDFQKLTNLKVLQLHSDKELRMVLYIGGLKMLQMLHLRLGKLKTLPDDLEQLTSLTEMCLDGCQELLSLPDVRTLRLLKTLSLGGCHGLKSLPESLGTLTGLTTLILHNNLLITELPKSFIGLISLVHLNMSRCSELGTVKALPHNNLRHLDLGNCSKLDHLPSFEGLTSLATLTLCNCVGLKEIQGLDCLTTLEEVNLTGCTSMQPRTLLLEHNRAMRSCCLSGSNVAVKYNNDWSESESELQLITYYDNAFEFVDNGLVQRVSSVEHCHKVFIEATVVGENEGVSIVICCVAHDQGWADDKSGNGHYRSECFLDAWIVRKGREVFRSSNLITLKYADCRNQVYLCTLRRTHPLVRDLKHEDKIQVAARSHHPKWAITVECGAICVVHGHSEDQVIFVNSREEKKAEFAGLILADNPECPIGQVVPSAPSVPILEPGSFYVVPKFFLHTFDRYWRFPSPGQGVLSFVARAVDDMELHGLSICLSPQRGQTVPRYEICIGDALWWIRRHVWHDSDSNQYGIVRFFQLDHPLGCNPLWVSIDKENRQLRVGQGKAREEVVLEYEDPDFFSDVQYISFSTYDTPVIYSDIVVM